MFHTLFKRMLLDKVGTELKKNPSWYNPLVGAMETTRPLIRKKVTKMKRREDIQLEVKK